MKFWKKLLRTERSPMAGIRGKEPRRPPDGPILGSETFQDAIGKRDWDKVREMIEENPDLVFSRDKYGSTPLHAAASNGRKSLVIWLLAHYAEINALDTYSRTALTVAAQEWERSALPARADAYNDKVPSPSSYAESDRYDEIEKLLMQCGGRDYYAEIHAATKKNDLTKLEELFGKIPGLVSCASTDEERETPLHVAAEQGHLETAKFLLANKASVRATDSRGFTPLHWAVARGHIQIAEMLLTSGADVNAKGRDDLTPLHWMRSKEMAELLLSGRCDLNARDRERKTPFDRAEYEGCWDVVEVFLIKSTDVSPLRVYRSSHDPLSIYPSWWRVREKLDQNLDRWKKSGEAKAWVREHRNGWSHEDWLELLASLRKSQYWPMQEAAIGLHIEATRARLNDQFSQPD